MASAARGAVEVGDCRLGRSFCCGSAILALENGIFSLVPPGLRTVHSLHLSRAGQGAGRGAARSSDHLLTRYYARRAPLVFRGTDSVQMFP